MPTTARFHALQWFHDHEAGGPDAVFSRKPPTVRMRRLMAKEGEVVRLPLGQFEHFQWRLTPLGREALAKKPPARRSRSMTDAKRRRSESSERPPG
jgi:hypothetical protein